MSGNKLRVSPNAYATECHGFHRAAQARLSGVTEFSGQNRPANVSGGKVAASGAYCSYILPRNNNEKERAAYVIHVF
jgi:hypothetical protein